MLTFPLLAAAASAGLLGGIHCAGMCGGMASMLGSAASKGRIVIPIAVAPASAVSAQSEAAAAAWLHAGRISTYAVMGAVVGLLGAAGLLLKPFAPVHAILFIIGNLALIWLGLRLAGYAPMEAAFTRFAGRHALPLAVQRSLQQHTQRHPYLAGMAWGCLPCGLLYGVLPFALLSGDPFSGAILMTVFGLAALPYLLLAQGSAQWLHRRNIPFALKAIGAAGLIGLGVYGLLHVGAADVPAFFCITPKY